MTSFCATYLRRPRAIWLLVALLLVAACATHHPAAPPGGSSAGGTSPRPVAADSSPVAPYIATGAVIPPQPMLIADGLPPFAWQEQVSAAQVPDRGVAGRLAKRAFIARDAVVTSSVEGRRPFYRLRLSSRPRAAGSAFEDDSVCVEWHQPAGPGEWSKAMDDHQADGVDAWYVVRDPDGGPRTCHAEFALWAKIEALAGATQAGGAPSLRGRLVVVFKDEPQSWVAGRFVADGRR